MGITGGGATLATSLGGSRAPLVNLGGGVKPFPTCCAPPPPDPIPAPPPPPVSPQDCIFMGLIKVLQDQDPAIVRLWVAPATGAILCADERFADNFGVTNLEIAGRPFSTLGPDIEALEK
jgi:hypothetical protein